jgi:hypothetical protein
VLSPERFSELGDEGGGQAHAAESRATCPRSCALLAGHGSRPAEPASAAA